MQTHGSLTETGLDVLLTTVKVEKATGLLTVERPGANCSLFFLFGNLFHASGPDGDGEEIVLGALRWREGTFTFDPRAKLPAAETVRASARDLLAEAERRGAPSSGAEVVEEAEVRSVAAGDLDPASPAASGGAEPREDVATPGTTHSAPASADQPVDEQTPASATAGDEAANPGVPAPAGEGAHQVGAHSPVPAGPEATHPTGDPSRASFNRRATDALPLAELYPLPAGKAVYERLKSAILFFPKLMATLQSDGHTGYLRLVGDGFEGTLLLNEGRLIEALFKEEEVASGEAAFWRLRVKMEAGLGACDLIELGTPTVVSLCQLLMGRPVYTGLLGRFVHFDALLDQLREDHLNGSVVVQGGGDTGVILLEGGEVLGAYTTQNPEVDADAARVAAIAANSTSRIEVKGGLDALGEIDVEAALQAQV